MSLALDAHEILDVVEGGAGRLGTDTWTHPNSPYTRDATGAHLSDRLAAEQLLEAAGYPASTRRQPDRARRPAAVAPARRGRRAGRATCTQRRHGGRAARRWSVSGPRWSGSTSRPLATVRSGDANAPPVDLLIGELESHAHDDPDHLFFLFHSSAGGLGDTFASYANPNFDALVEQTLAIPAEADERLDLIHQAQDILAQDLPVIVLYYPAGRTAYRPAAYDGWTSDAGHGVFTKRSLLTGYADVGGDDLHLGPRPEVEPFLVPADDGPNLLAIGGVGVAAVAGGSAAFLAFRDRRRRATTVEG